MQSHRLPPCPVREPQEEPEEIQELKVMLLQGTDYIWALGFSFHCWTWACPVDSLCLSFSIWEGESQWLIFRAL